MFEIHPVDGDKSGILARKAGVELPVSAMMLWENGEERGHILYRIEGDRVELLTIDCSDPDLAQWLIRGALNAAANRAAVTAVCGNAALFSSLDGLGFVQKGDKYSLHIPDLFSRPCAGCC